VTGDSSPDLTRLLLAGAGERESHRAQRQRLFELLYDELRRSARRLMNREQRAHVLSPTALVHEAYLRLIDQTRVDGVDRARFLVIAGRAMRQILIEFARARDAQKRGKGWRRITIETRLMASAAGHFDAIALDDALDALAREDERAATVTELKVFAGLTREEIATALGVSPRTVDGDWAFARKWLSREMR
jgi:RNA polymerase sigma-70 factor (ECF subfamily)